MKLELKLKFNRIVMCGYINKDNEYIIHKGFYKGTDEYGKHYCGATTSKNSDTYKAYSIVIPRKMYNPYNINKSLEFKL